MWTREEIAGKTADVFDVPTPRGVVLFLHNYNGESLREDRVYTPLFEREKLACVCPLAPRSWWLDVCYPPFDQQLTPLQFLKEHLPSFCEQRWNLSCPSLALVGMEMGGQGVLQLAYRQARWFPIVVAISPKVDFESWYGGETSLDRLFPDREAARQHTATLQVNPLDWPRYQLLLCDPADEYCIDGVLTLASKLSSSGISFERDFETTYGGYGWEYAHHIAPRVVSHIVRSLSDVERRLEVLNAPSRR
ncbi:MAG: hypothetical protein KatS3mg114_1176 [Planctomycetaceae bacterium]|nr:MAG: hypothetical protein KatS3mg114_1176 [Planctomycetaceae bacterium]